MPARPWKVGWVAFSVRSVLPQQLHQLLILAPPLVTNVAPPPVDTIGQLPQSTAHPA